MDQSRVYGRFLNTARNGHDDIVESWLRAISSRCFRMPVNNTSTGVLTGKAWGACR